MKKLGVLLITMLILAGCGVTQKATDGSSGSNGSNGTAGRNSITPVFRPYTAGIIGTNTITFIDLSGNLVAKSQSIGWSSDYTSSFNGLTVYSGVNNSGKVINVSLNGVKLSRTIINNGNSLYTFCISNTPSTAWDTVKLASTSNAVLDINNQNSYISWSLDSTQQEFYWVDSFK